MWWRLWGQHPLVPFHLTQSKSKSSSFMTFYYHLFNCSGDVSVPLTAPEALSLLLLCDGLKYTYWNNMYGKLTKNPALQHRPVVPTSDVKRLYLSFEDFIAFSLMLLIYLAGLGNNIKCLCATSI